MPALGSICPLSCQVDRCVSFVFARAFRRALFKQPQVKPANQLGVACHILHAEDSTMDGLQPCEPVCKVHGPSSATRVARIAHVSPVAVIRDRSGGLNPLQELRPFMLEASDGENQAAYFQQAVMATLCTAAVFCQTRVYCPVPSVLQRLRALVAV